MGPTATKLGSWVYLFSKFTPEALLFEAFAILALIACYMAFWVLRKRRMGSIENAVPAGLVKVYLNQLIGEAEQLRAQLFGLLTGASPAAGQEAALRAMTPDLLASISAQLPAAAGGDNSKQLQALEAKMNEQAKAMEAVVVEKKRIEKELADARAAGSKTGGAVDDGMIAKLQEKIRILEGKLAEYSVIEDDLANLKRLQQENAQLKAALNKSGGSLPAETASPALAAQPTAAAPVPAPAPAPIPAAAAEHAPAPAAEPDPEPAAMVAEAVAPAPAPAAQPAAAAAAPAADPGFEALVDEVEKSLADSPAPTPPAGAEVVQATPAPAAASTPSLESILTSAASPGGAPSQEKTDADLVAEFEKMLKG